MNCVDLHPSLAGHIILNRQAHGYTFVLPLNPFHHPFAASLHHHQVVPSIIAASQAAVGHLLALVLEMVPILDDLVVLAALELPVVAMTLLAHSYLNQFCLLI